MADQVKKSIVPKFISRLMPQASEAELLSAADVFRQYIAIVLRIHTRLQREAQSTDSHESQS